jgi:peptidoglycan/LPS O-acetylase OafA/YrhL
MVFHFNRFFLPQASLTSISPLMRPILGRAYLGVDLFFLMSGLVMAHVYGQKLSSNWRAHWRDFAILRFARIYPLFVLTLLVMVVTHALSTLPLAPISFSVRSLALQPLLLQAWVPLSWNYPSWSISTEAAAYTFFVFSAGALLTGRHPRLITAICVAILATISIRRAGSLNVFTGLPAVLRAIAEFSLGALLYRANLASNISSSMWPALLAFCCLAFAALTHWDIAIVGVFACLVSYGANAKTILARSLGSGPAIAIGAWSYSIFLLHAPVHYAVMAGFSAYGYPTATLDVATARWLMLSTMLAVVCLSTLTFDYFEVPARRAIRRALLGAQPTLGPDIGAPGSGEIGTPLAH